MLSVPYRRSAGWIFRKIRGHFLTGLLVMVPLGITILILIWLFNTIDNILQPVIVALWHHHIPGVGFAVTLLLIYIAGVIGSNFIGKRLVLLAESFLERIPLIKHLYPLLKGITSSFSRSTKKHYLQVVLVEYPRKEVRSIGFITNEIEDGNNGEKLFSVFIPNSPNPASGFVHLFHENDMVRTKLTVNEALKMLVSAGSVSPKTME